MNKTPKKTVKIGIDVDGVLRDFDTKVMEIIKREFPDKVLDDTTHGWDFPNVDMPIEELSKLWRETHTEEIYQDAELMPNAKEELALLKEWTRAQRDRYQYLCVTSQMPYLAHHTYYWLGKNKFNFMNVIISNNKHTTGIDMLVDDSPKNYDKWVKAGMDEASFILFDRPYNQDCPATNRIKKLSDLINILKN